MPLPVVAEHPPELGHLRFVYPRIAVDLSVEDAQFSSFRHHHEAGLSVVPAGVEAARNHRVLLLVGHPEVLSGRVEAWRLVRKLQVIGVLIVGILDDTSRTAAPDCLSTSHTRAEMQHWLFCGVAGTLRQCV